MEARGGEDDEVVLVAAATYLPWGYLRLRQASVRFCSVPLAAPAFDDYIIGMTITLELPESAAAVLRGAWDDLPMAALESLAVEGYRSGKLSSAEVGKMLGHSNRWESEDFLAAHHAWPGTTRQEFEADLATLEHLRRA